MGRRLNRETLTREESTQMNGSPPCQRLRQRIEADVPADELERLAHVDALLRIVPARDRDEACRDRRERPAIPKRPTPR
jgi:hypothetical protein